MRQVGLSDLDIAARAVMMVEPEDQPTQAARLIAAAHCADHVRKRTGQPAPDGGTGSLYAQASLARPAAHGVADAAYCEALMTVLAALKAHRAAHLPR